MRKFLRIISAIILVVLPVLPLVSTPVHAQQKEREGIGISPTKQAPEANPGEQVTGQVTVTNPGTQPVKYRVYAKDFSIRNEEYEKDFEPIPGAVSPVDWITLPQDVKTLAPGAQEALTYSITIPQDAVPRGYYAVIFAETTAAEANVTGVTRLKRVGSLIYLTVKGGSVEKGQLLSFDVPRWQRDRPVKAHLRIGNEGNIHFSAAGEVRLKDVFGRTISRTEISGTILPATVRKFSPELKLGQPFGIYKIEGEANVLGDTAQLSSKWILVGSPFWLGLWVVIIIGWAIVLIRWIRRRVARNKSKK